MQDLMIQHSNDNLSILGLIPRKLTDVAQIWFAGSVCGSDISIGLE